MRLFGKIRSIHKAHDPEPSCPSSDQIICLKHKQDLFKCQIFREEEEEMEREPTRVMVAVNESTIKGKPHPSISSKRAFEWTLEKMIRSNTSDFKILLLHVHVVDEDGFDEVDSIYASPDDFKESNKSKGLHLLEFFVKKCHEIGVNKTPSPLFNLSSSSDPFT